MKQAKAITKNCYNLSRIGKVVELQHRENGLPKGTELLLEKSGLTWKVLARVLFDHAVHEQVIFITESVEYALFRFESSHKREASIRNIKETESQYTFQYLLKGDGHDQKPIEGGMLDINAV